MNRERRIRNLDFRKGMKNLPGLHREAGEIERSLEAWNYFFAISVESLFPLQFRKNSKQ